MTTLSRHLINRLSHEDSTMTTPHFPRTLLPRSLVLAISAAILVGCSAQPTRDRFDLDEFRNTRPDAEAMAAEQSLSAQQRQARLRELLEAQAAMAPVIPAEPPEYNPLDEVRVDLVVENAELQFILRALASQAGLNLVIHPNLIGTPYRISLEFRDVTASQVLRQVARIADVDFSLDDNTLIVNPMQERVFQLGFMESNTSNSFSAGGDVLGGGSRSSSGGGSGGSGSGSGRQIQGEFTYSGSSMPNSNAYDQLEDMLVTLIGRSGNAQPANLGSASSIEEIGRMSRLGSAIRQDMPAYSLNRITGTLYVRAKPSVMGAVANLIETYEAILGGQVLIDAQIIEVKLDEAFRFGVDWTDLRDNMATAFSDGIRSVTPLEGEFGSLGQGSRGLTISGTSLGGSGGPSLSINRVHSNLAVAVDAMQRYGDVSVLSNPTLRSKHGQPAIISVGTSSTFVADTRVVTSAGAGGNGFSSQEIRTSQVFDGLMIGVVPFIDRAGNISLSVHPVQSKVDPNSLALINTGGDTRVTLPTVELKSMVTQLTMRSGDAVILGGLIDQVDARRSTEVPGFGRIPILGNLFRQRANEESLRELILVLRVELL